jgi:CubicO group peptidase (beta-lactamase class C family)
MYVSRGLASVEWKQPITSDTVFDIASNSKQFTAALVYQLVEEGPRSAQAGGRLPA